MRIQIPKNDSKYHWTNHVAQKMIYYGLSAERVKRVIRSPHRSEKGVAPDTIAVMCPGSRSRSGFAGQKTSSSLPGRPDKADWKEEIWVMYAVKNRQPTTNNLRQKPGIVNQMLSVVGSRSLVSPKKVIITAWRYPGVSKIREAIPIPSDILEELKSIKY